MSLHVIVGAGAVGSDHRPPARRRAASRSGSSAAAGPARSIRASSASPPTPPTPTGSARSRTGAVAIYNCVNPLYHQWFTDWPPIADALRTAAERSGAVLVDSRQPLPVRSGHRADHRGDPARGHAPEAPDPRRHVARRSRRAPRRADPDDRGPGQRLHRGELDLELRHGQAAAGRQARVRARPRSTCRTAGPRSTTSPGCSSPSRADERAWGRAWHVPTNDPLTVRELAQQFTEVAGAPRAEAVARCRTRRCGPSACSTRSSRSCARPTTSSAGRSSSTRPSRRRRSASSPPRWPRRSATHSAGCGRRAAHRRRPDAVGGPSNRSSAAAGWASSEEHRTSHRRRLA